MMRWIVITVGAALTIVYARRYWFPGRAPAGERRGARVSALLVFLARAAPAADRADDPAAPHDRRAAERWQDLALQDRRRDGPEAALGDQIGQLGSALPERRRRPRLGARRLRAEEAPAIAAS